MPAHRRLEAQGAGRLASVVRVAVLAALVLLFCRVASTVVVTFVVAVLYAYVLDPAVVVLERRRVPRVLAILLAIAASLALLGLLAYFLWTQLERFQQDFPKYRHELEELAAAVRGFLDRLRQRTQTLVPPAPPPPGDAPAVVAVRDDGSPLLAWSGRLLGAVNVLVVLTLIPFLTFFMLSGKRFFRDGTAALLCRYGWEPGACRTMLDDVSRQIRWFAVGKLVLHAILAVLTTAALLAIGVDYAWIWGPLSAVIALVPVFGFILGMLPPVLIALIQFDSPAPALWVVVAFVAIQLVETYVLTPKVVGRTVNLNALASLTAVLLFGWLWGAVGTILALPIAAAVKAVCDHVDGLREVGALLGAGETEPA
jgi:predicted PurR-regulated permease PerM